MVHCFIQMISTQMFVDFFTAFSGIDHYCVIYIQEAKTTQTQRYFYSINCPIKYEPITETSLPSNKYYILTLKLKFIF